MSDIELINVSKTFGDTRVIDNLSLSIKANELMVFLGPSGCGKSTLLRMIAGLEAIDSGEIWIGGQRVDGLPPGERRVAMVFQHYALYPHMTVRENMSFGLRNARMARDELNRRVNQAAKMLEIEPLLERKPAQISGGQRQRVAIGRAIVKEPKLFLFDEPLSNLDAALRVRTRIELAQLHQRVGSAMIFVTHDQVEAMTLAQRILVMNGRRIEQIGTPMEIYSRPATQFVAGFVGTPAMNFVPAQIVTPSVQRGAATPMRHEQRAMAETAGAAIQAQVGEAAYPSEARTSVHVLQSATKSDRFAVVQLLDGSVIPTHVALAELPASGALKLGVRAESIDIVAPGAGHTSGRVKFVERLGDRTLIYVCLADDTVLVAEDAGTSRVSIGDTVGLRIDAAATHLFDEQRAYHASAEAGT